MQLSHTHTHRDIQDDTSVIRVEKQDTSEETRTKQMSVNATQPVIIHLFGPELQLIFKSFKVLCWWCFTLKDILLSCFLMCFRLQLVMFKLQQIISCLSFLDCWHGFHAVVQVDLNTVFSQRHQPVILISGPSLRAGHGVTFTLRLMRGT